MALILVGGGARSGKSTFALQVARERGAELAYVATAEALDDEMRERIAVHQRDRGAGFRTIEEPVDVAGVLAREADWVDAVVIDCLTLWWSNLMLSNRDAEQETGRMISAATQTDMPIIAVTNEVGCGIVPENALARQFRDLAGRLNQRVAAASTEVWWMVFGCPVRIK